MNKRSYFHGTDLRTSLLAGTIKICL